MLHSILRPCLRIRHALAFALLSCGATASAQTPYTWTGTTDGLWSTGTNWSTTPTVPPFATSAPFDNVVFNASSTGTLATTLELANLTLNQIVVASPAADVSINIGGTSPNTLTILSGFDLSAATKNLTVTADAGNSLVLGGNNSWSVNTGQTLTVNAPVSGAFSITKTGSGTLLLNAGTNTSSSASTYSGGFILQAGTVDVRTNSTPATSPVTSGPFGTGLVTIQGGTLTAGTTAASVFGNDILIAGNASFIPNFGNGIEFKGTSTIAAGLTINFGGANFLTLLDNPVLEGDLTTTGSGGYAFRALSGTMNFGATPGNRTITNNSTGTTASVIRGTLAFPGNTLTLKGTQATAVGSGSGPATGATGGIIVDGAPVTFGAANTFTGGVRVLSGSAIAGASTVGTITSGPFGTDTFRISGGNVRTDGTARTVANTLILDASASFGAATGSANITFTGDSQTISGNPTLTLAGNTTTFAPATASISLLSPLTFAGAGNAALGSLTETGGPFSLTMNGTGTVSLIGTTTITGTTTISSGTVQVGNAAALPGSASDTIVNNGTLAFSSTTAQVYNGTISGTGALNRLFATGSTAASTLTLGGTSANTYTGLTTFTGNFANSLILNKPAGVNAIGGDLTIIPTGGGALPSVMLMANEQIPDTATVTLVGISGAGGSSINFNGFNETIGSLVINNNQGSSGITVPTGTATLTVNGPITLTGTSTGTIAISGNLNLGGQTRTITVGTTNQAVTISALIANGGITKAGASPLLLTGTNTFTGPVTINGSVLGASVIADGGISSSLGASSNAASNLTLDGGTLRYTGTAAATTDRNYTIGAGGATFEANGGTGFTIGFTGSPTFSGSGARTVTLTGTNTGTNLFSGLITNAGADTVSLVKSGAGFWSVPTANTFTGPVTIAAGTLSVAVLANGGSPSGLGASGNAASNLTFNGGTLQYVGSTAATTDRNFTLTAATTLDASGTVPAAAVAFTGSPTNNAASGTIALTLTGSNTGNNVFSGVIADGATSVTSIVKSGVGTWTLSGANTFSGSVSLGSTGSTLNLGNASALGNGTGAFIASGNGTFDNTSGTAFTVANPVQLSAGSPVFIGTNNLTFSNTVTISGASRTITVTNASANLTFGGAIGQDATNRSLTKAGDGAITLNGTNTFAGGFTLTLGTVYLGNASALGTGAVTITTGTIDNTSGGALTMANTGNVSINGDFTFTGSNNLSFANGTVSNNAGSRIVTIGGTGRTLAFGIYTSTANASTTLTANGAGNLLALGGISLTSPSATINGARTVTLAGSSDFLVTGSIVNGNTAVFNHALTITSTGTVTISAAQTFTGTFTMNSATGTAIVTGDKSGIGGVTLTTGTLTLSGNNTHTGATTLSAGTLNIGSDTALGTGAVTLNAGTIDAVNGARTLTNNNTFTLGGTVAFGGTNNLNLGTGTMSSSAGRTLTLNGSSSRVLSIGTYQFTSTSGASTLTVNATGNSSLSLTNFNLSADTVTARTQVLAGNGNVTITGSVVPGNGTLATHAFSITNSGTVTINGTQSYNGLLTVNMTPIGVLNIGGVKSGTGGLTQTTGTVNVTSASTYTGATAVNGGTLNLGNGGSLGTTAVSLATGTVLNVIPGANGATNAIGSTLTLAAGVTFSMLDNATSTFNVAGAATLAPASGTAQSLSFNLGSTVGTTDFLNISGIATVGAGGAKIFLVPTAAPAPGNYTIIGGAATSNLNSANLTLNSSKISFNNLAYPVTLANSTTTATVVTVGAAGGPDIVYWTGAAGSNWNAVGTGTNWNTSVAGGVDSGTQPGALTDVFFATTNPVSQNLTNTLGQDYTIGSLNFLATSPAVTINSGNNLTINGIATNGITVAAGSAAHTINAAVILGGAQTWTNNSTNALTLGGSINTAGFALTTAGTGTLTFSGVLSGTGALSVAGGTLNLNAAGNAVSALTVTGTLNLNTSLSPTGILTMNGGSVLNVAGGTTLTLGNLGHLIGNTNGTATLNVLAGANLVIGSGSGTTVIGPSASSGLNTGKIDASLATGSNAVLISVVTLGFASNGGAAQGSGMLILPTSLTATSTITATTSVVIASNSNGGQDAVLSTLDFGGGSVTIDTPSMTVGGSKSSGAFLSSAGTGSLTLKNGAAGKMGLAIGNNSANSTASAPSSTFNVTTTGVVNGTLGAVTMAALQSSGAAGKSTASFILNAAASSLITLDSITTGTQSGTVASTSGGSISTITVTGGTMRFNSGGTGILYGSTGTAVVADGRTSTVNVNGANAVLDLNGKPIYATSPTTFNTTFSTAVNLNNGTLQNVSTLGTTSASFAFNFTGGTWLNSAVASQSLPYAVAQLATTAASTLQVNSGMTTTIGGAYSLTGNASPARQATALVNGTLSAGTNTISVNAVGVLTGGGSVTSPVAFASGSTFQPGSSSTAPNLTLNPGAGNTVAFANGMTVALAIYNAGTGGTNGGSTSPSFPAQTTNSGFLQTSGTLTGLTNSSAITFQIDGTGTTFAPSTSYSYQVGSVAGQDFTTLNLTSAGGATFTPVGINADANSFSLTGSGSAIYLNFTTSAVPEPMTVGLLAAVGLAIGGWGRRRK